jgi:hypothetical protein
MNKSFVEAKVNQFVVDIGNIKKDGARTANNICESRYVTYSHCESIKNYIERLDSIKEVLSHVYDYIMGGGS